MTLLSAANAFLSEDSFLEDDIMQTNESNRPPACWLCGGNVHAKLKYCTSCGKEQTSGHVKSNPGLVDNYRRHSRSCIEDLSFSKSRKSFDNQRVARKVVINVLVSIMLFGIATAGIQFVPDVSTARDAVVAALSADGLKENSYKMGAAQEPGYSTYQPVSYTKETEPQYRY